MAGQGTEGLRAAMTRMKVLAEDGETQFEWSFRAGTARPRTAKASLDEDALSEYICLRPCLVRRSSYLDSAVMGTIPQVQPKERRATGNDNDIV